LRGYLATLNETYSSCGGWSSQATTGRRSMDTHIPCVWAMRKGSPKHLELIGAVKFRQVLGLEDESAVDVEVEGDDSWRAAAI
jgi:hypothetical protein